MTLGTSLHHEHPDRPQLTVERALLYAWRTWITLLAIPFLLVLGLVWHMGFGQVGTAGGNVTGWFFGAMIFIAVVIPASFFAREKIFSSYWTGQVVSPRKYLAGMVTVWIALDLAGIFCVLGSIMTESLMPNLIPSVILLLYFFTQWPMGRAMVHSAGHEEDAQLYKEPR